MSTSTLARRRLAARIGIVGLGTAIVLATAVDSAGAAPGVVVPLEPSEVVLEAGDTSFVDPTADPSAPLASAVVVQYGGTLTVNLPSELDDSGAGAELVFDDNGDGIPEATYSSRFTLANPNHLTVTGQGTGSIEITLPAADPMHGDTATLTLQPLASTLSQAFTYLDPIYYDLGFDAAAPTAQVVAPQLIAYSRVPCGHMTVTRCPFPTPVTPGSTVTLELTPGSVLRELGIVDLTGVHVAVYPLDDDGFPVGATAVEPPMQVTGDTASFTFPVDATSGAYGLSIAQMTAVGGFSSVDVELTVVAAPVVVLPGPAAPVVVLPGPAAPVVLVGAAAPVLNRGLRSNTGVLLAGATASGSASGGMAVAAGAGVLLVVVVGVAIGRSRRRSSAANGPWEA